tara:strand:+ start:84 stop:749 length:666 start_codon:yes stop_codon:yes gene_type:complete
MSGLSTVTAYSTDPVTSSDVKIALRIPTGDSTHNTLITSCINAATKIIMENTQRTLTQETLKLGLDALPYNETASYPYSEGLTVAPFMSKIGRALYLPRPPLISITHVKTFDDSDNSTTLAASTYYIDKQNPIPRVILRTGQTWDNLLRVANAIEVTYVAGYGTNAGTVPAPLKQAITVLAVNYFENPEPILKGESTSIVSGLIESLIRPYKVTRFGIGFS